MTRIAKRTVATEKATFQFDGMVIGLFFLSDGALAIALGDGSVRFIGSADTGKALAVRPHETKAAILAATIDFDRAAILTGGDDGRLLRVERDGCIHLLAEFPGQQVDVIAANAYAGLRAAAGGRQVQLIDRNGALVGSTSDHPSTVTGLAAAHYNGVSVWPVACFGSDPIRLNWKGSHIAVSWSPDGSTVITSMQGRELHGWPLAGGQQMIMRGYPTKVRALDWLAKPMILFSSGGDAVVAWKFTGGGPMGKAPAEIGCGIGQSITALAVRPRHKIVTVGFDDGRVALCGIGKGNVHHLRAADSDRIAALAWSGDGTWLATGGEAGAVSLFEVSNALA